MKLRTVLLIMILLVIFSGCTQKKAFDFQKDWTWEELTAFTTDQTTQDRISQLQAMLSIEQARFLLAEINKFDKPEAIYHFTEMEKAQKKKGAGFHDILPDHFQNKNIIPVPDNFNNQIKTALYFTKVRANNLRDLLMANMNYNVDFIDEKLEAVKLSNSNIQLRLNTAAIEAVLDLYKDNEKNFQAAEAIAGNDVFVNMLTARRKAGNIPAPYPDAEDLAYFILNSAKESPQHKIWNWINPANNFGFSELYNNRIVYDKFLAYLKKDAEAFTNRIIAPLHNYLPASVSYSGEIDLGINFGVNIWSNNNRIGANLAQIKDDFHFYTIALRKAVFQQIHKEMIIKAPNFNDPQDFVYTDMRYWNFKSEKDREFYSILTLIYQEGISTFVSGRPKDFDFIYQMKESVGILPQLYGFTYDKPDPVMIGQLISFGSKRNGPFAGLGYLMARGINSYFGEDEITRCIKNGPIYFFNKYYDIYSSKDNPPFKHFDDKTIQKIKELYLKQKPYFVE